MVGVQLFLPQASYAQQDADAATSDNTYEIAPGARQAAEDTSPKSPLTNTTENNTAGKSAADQGVRNAGNAVENYLRGADLTTLAQQAGEQRLDNSVTGIENALGDGLGVQNDVYQGLHKWYSDDVVSRLFRSIGQLMSKWITEFVNGWICPAAQFLSGVLRTFMLNHNVAIGNTDIDRGIRQVADIIYAIATDLLLLWFILCIWKYWTEAQWRGMVNIMSPVLRLITTTGILIAWPTLYTFVVQISNEMIKAIWFNSAAEAAQLDTAIADSIRLGFIAGLAGLVKGIAPILGDAAYPIAIAGKFGPLAGDVISFVAGFIFTFLGGIIVVELISLIILKGIQTILLLAQYMFAPLFIVMFAAPDTEMYTTKFMYGFVAVNLWSFFWIGCLRILVIVMNSDYEPWGKILIAIGALTLMLYAPAFQMAGVIEPTSPFLNPRDLLGKVAEGMEFVGNAITSKLEPHLPGSGPPGLSTMSTSTPQLNGLGGPAAGAQAAGGANLNVQNANNQNAQAQNAQAQNAQAAAAQNQQGQQLNMAQGQMANGQGQLGAGVNIAGAGAQGNLGINPGQANIAGLPKIPDPNPWQSPWSGTGKLASDNDKKGAIAGNAKAVLANKRIRKWSKNGKDEFSGSKDGISYHRSENASDEDAERNDIVSGMASFTGEEADEAKRVSAIAYGFDKPETAEEKFYAARLARKGIRFEDSAYGQAKLAKNMFKAGILDSQAYMAGKKGNGYDQYLARELGGAYTPELAGAIHGLYGDPINDYSPESTKFAAIKSHLEKLGIKDSAANMNSYGNDNVKILGKGEQQIVIPEMGALVTKEVDSLYPNATATQRVSLIASVAHSKNAEFVQQILDMHHIAPEGTAGVVYEVHAELLQQNPNQTVEQSKAWLQTVSNHWGVQSPNLPSGAPGKLIRHQEKITKVNARQVVSAMNTAGVNINDAQSLDQFRTSMPHLWT